MSITSNFDKHQDTITHYMYLGLLPFFIGALGPWLLPDEEKAFSQLFFFYSTIILSFLAGALWAIALFTEHARPARHLHTAIVFSLWPLIAYVIVFFLPLLVAIGFMLIGFLLLLFWEKCFINVHYPEWYQNMRHKITFIVAGCHMLVIFNLLRLAATS